jgi:hypothetical protein
MRSLWLDEDQCQSAALNCTYRIKAGEKEQSTDKDGRSRVLLSGLGAFRTARLSASGDIDSLYLESSISGSWADLQVCHLGWSGGLQVCGAARGSIISQTISGAVVRDKARPNHFGPDYPNQQPLSIRGEGVCRNLRLRGPAEYVLCCMRNAFVHTCMYLLFSPSKNSSSPGDAAALEGAMPGWTRVGQFLLNPLLFFSCSFFFLCRPLNFCNSLSVSFIAAGNAHSCFQVSCFVKTRPVLCSNHRYVHVQCGLDTAQSIMVEPDREQPRRHLIGCRLSW